MRQIDIERMKKHGLNTSDFEPKTTPTTIEITREDFDLLEVEQDVTYHITEPDGTLTIKKGMNV